MIGIVLVGCAAGLAVVALSPSALIIIAMALTIAIIAFWKPFWLLVGVLLLGPFLAVLRAELLASRPDIPSSLITGSVTGCLALSLLAAAVRYGSANSMWHKADLALAFLVVLQIPFLAFSPDMVVGLTALRVAFEGTLAYMCIRVYRPTEREIWVLVGAILASAGTLAASAVFQEALGPQYIRTFVEGTLQGGVQEISGGYVRAPSLVGSANTASWCFLLAIALTASLAAAVRQGLLRVLFLVGLCVFVAGMLVTLVRASWIGLVVAGLYSFTFSPIRGKPLFVVVLTAVLVGLAAIAVAFSESLPIAIRAILQSPLYEYDSLRFASWQGSVASLLQNPVGHGLGTQGAVSQRYFALVGIPGESDNWYLKLALESGLLALVTFVAFMAFVFSAARSATCVAGPSLIRALIGGSAAALAGFAIVNVFSNGWDWFPANLYYWVIAAIVVHYGANSSARYSNGDHEERKGLRAARS
jgi:hypothetical protein